MSYLKKIGMVLAILIIILAVLNPGKKQFKEYRGIPSENDQYVRRTSNYLVFSIYTYVDEKYVGALLNFFDITPPQPKVIPAPTDSVSVYPVDTTL